MKRRLSLELVRVPGNYGARRVDLGQESLADRNDPLLKFHSSPWLVGTSPLLFVSLCFIYTVGVIEKRLGEVVSVPHCNTFSPLWIC